MIPKDLERLVDKESFKIVVVNGNPPMFENLSDQLKYEGYTVAGFEGPKLSGLSSLEKVKEYVKGDDLNPILIPHMLVSKGLIKEITFQENPDLILSNYKETGKAFFIHGLLSSLAKRGIKNAASSILMTNSDYNDLLQGLDTIRSYKLFTYNTKDLIKKIRLYKCDPTGDIMSNCERIQNLIFSEIKNEGDIKDLNTALKKEIKTTYKMVNANILLYEKKEINFIFLDIKFRLSAVYSILYWEDMNYLDK